jgi:putative redox protein
VEGDTTSDHPKTYYRMHVIYELKGNDLDLEKVEKAINLSEERYCGVSAVYRKAGIEMTHEVRMV